MNIKERFYQNLQEAREQLDEVSRELAKRAEHKAAKKYYDAYDQEKDDRKDAMTKKTPEARKKAEESGEKRKKSAKRVIRFQKYADKKKMNEETEQLDEENTLKDFTPPFSANGLWVSDKKGNNVLEVTRHGKVAKQVADALNKHMNK